MKILFLSDNFPPEYNAPATRTYEHCREWVKLGAEVTVVTCFPNFPKGEVFDGYLNKWKQVDYVDGIRVIRVWSFISANRGTFKRMLDFLSYAVTSFLAGLSLKFDVIIATSPQFFTAVSGCGLSFFKRKPWIMEVRDIWPESIKAVEALQTGWVINLLEKLELLLYRRAKKIVVVTDAFKDNLTNRGVPADKVHIVKNGVDLSVYQPMPKNPHILRMFNIQDAFIIGYVGTHGLAHSLDFIIRCIKKLSDKSIHFIFIGDGAEKENLIGLASKLGVKNLNFIEPVKKSEINNYLSILDVALVPLRKSKTFESVIPSKIFESAAMEIPILLGVEGESKAIIEHYQAGVCFEPENEVDFIEKVSQMKHEVRTSNRYRAGCRRLAEEFDRNLLAKKMLQIISE